MRASLAHRLPFYYGWVVVGVCFVAGPFLGTLTSWGIGVFVLPMQEELGWSRSLFFMPLAIGAVISGLLGPIIGPFIDRKGGPETIFLVGVVLFGVTTALIRVVDSFWEYFLFFGLIGGVGRLGFNTVFMLVPKWFVRRRGLAQAFVGAGFSIGPLVFPLLLQVLVDSVGWRNTWLIMGVSLLVLLVPGALLIARAPEDLGLQVDGGATAGQPAAGAPGSPGGGEAERSFTRGEALRTRQFWLLMVAACLGTLAIRGVIPNLQSFFIDQGLSPTMAAVSFSAYALVAFFTVLFWGAMADRIGARRPYLMVIALTLTALVFLSFVGSVPVLFIAMVYLGLGLNGYFNLWQVYMANIFGRRHIGAIRGAFDPFFVAAHYTGPLVFGAFYDLSESYRWLFAAAVVAWGVTFGAAYLVRPLGGRAAPAPWAAP